ncbi:hypothetical protein [Glycomyces artemisiae]|uniref:Uncharacterized protein n=1 Tax=Glycomyces artemisiae TaxID=1076443 RepID=A0A2T0UDX6_9ACTN|nr:hypothetical protein [Glycomyces artemisiae]PRY56017.1 hypothetical protein B0I28_111123 [Glycomyces artemisiae]
MARTATQETRQGSVNEFENLGEWQTSTGNILRLKARRKTGYASVWLDYNGHPIKIGHAIHAGGVVREMRWEAPSNEQTPAWKVQQRSHIASLIADWHAGNTRPVQPAPLPTSVLGVFDLDGFRFAVEPTLAAEHAVLSVVNTENALMPVADLLHDNGRICGLVTRPGWKGTPDERRRHWRSEAEHILTLAAQQGRL